MLAGPGAAVGLEVGFATEGAFIWSWVESVVVTGADVGVVVLGAAAPPCKAAGPEAVAETGAAAGAAVGLVVLGAGVVAGAAVAGAMVVGAVVVGAAVAGAVAVVVLLGAGQAWFSALTRVLMQVAGMSFWRSHAPSCCTVDRGRPEVKTIWMPSWMLQEGGRTLCNKLCM